MTAEQGTAFTVPPASQSGFGPVFRKEIDEWFKTNRFEITLFLATLLAVAPAAIYWVYKGGIHAGRITLADKQYNSIISAPALLISTFGLFMVIALTMGMITREQDKGTLQWVFTKPVSRSAFVLAKWLANGVMTVFSVAVLPLVITYVAIDLLFGVRDWTQLIEGVIGLVFLFIFQCALSCGLAAITGSSGVVAGVSFAMFVAPAMLNGVIGDWSRLFPSAISEVARSASRGDGLDRWDAGTIISTMVVTVLLLVFATIRLSRREYR